MRSNFSGTSPRESSSDKRGKFSDMHPSVEEDGSVTSQKFAQKRKGAHWLRWIAFFLGLAVVLAVCFVPVPFVALGAGPTIDVLAKEKDKPVIEISGIDPKTGQPVAEYPPLDNDKKSEGEKGAGGTSSNGQLRMVTVSELGGPGYRMTTIGLIGALLDSHTEIFSYSSLYGNQDTADSVSKQSTAMMENSHSTSTVAALEFLGWKVPAKVIIEGGMSGSDIEGKVHSGDILKSIRTPDGVEHVVDSASVPFAIMRTVPRDSQMSITIERDGQKSEVPLTTLPPSKNSKIETENGSRLGLYLSMKTELPFNVKVNTEDIGGPSAGTMFALGIIDRLTPGDSTGGKSIAGTGALSYDGVVEPIGGIRQKMWGAKRDGAQWFLAPADNCGEVVGHVPDGLRIARITTLAQAHEVVQDIATDKIDSIPTCSG